MRSFFNQTSLTKKSTRNTKHARAVTSYDFRKGKLVSVLRLSRQVDVQGLFEPARQLRSSSCFHLPGVQPARYSSNRQLEPAHSKEAGGDAY
jgi:hypothetical protein